jgi:hypothetical protein
MNRFRHAMHRKQAMGLNRLALAVLSAAWLISACSGGAAPAPAPVDQPEVVLAKPTFTVDQSNIGQVSALAADLSSFSILASASTAPLETVGNLVLFGAMPQTPYGAARKITASTTSGGMVNLQTVPAALGDVFSKVKLSVPFSIDAQSAIDSTRTHLPTGISVRHADLVSMPRAQLHAAPVRLDAPKGDSNSQARKDGFFIGLDDFVLTAQSSGGTVSAKASVSANLFLSAHPQMVLNFDITSGIKEFSIGATFDEAVHAAVDVSGTIAWSDQIELAKIYLTPITILIPAGPLVIPLVFSPYVSLNVGGAIDSQVTAHASAGEEFSLTGKFGWIDGAFQSTFDKKLTTSYVPPYFDKAKAQIKFTVGAQAGIELYASPGVSVGANGYLALNADKSASPCFKLSVGIDGQTSADAKILDFQLAKSSKTWNITDLPLLTGVCDSPTGGVAQTLDAPGKLWGYTEEHDDDLGAVLAASPTSDDGLLLGRERNADSFIAKLDAQGAVKWMKTPAKGGLSGVQSLSLMRPVAIRERPDTSIAVLYGGPYPDQVMMVLDQDAAPLTVTKYAFPSDFSVGLRDFVPTAEWGAVMIGNGSVADVSTVRDRAAVLRVDGTGQVRWAQSLAGPDSSTDLYLASLALSPLDNTIVLAGYETGYAGEPRARLWVAKLDMDGKWLWSTLFHGVINDIGQHTSGAVAVGADGSVLLGGSYEYVVGGDFYDAPYAMKLDRSGKQVWLQGTTDSAFVNGVTVTADGGLVLSGQTPSGYALTTQKLWRARFNADGVLAWSKAYDSSPLLGRFDRTFEVAGNLVSLGSRRVAAARAELLVMTTIADGSIAFSAASGMTVSNLGGNAVDFSESPASFQPTLSALTVFATNVPLQSSAGTPIPVFGDVTSVKPTSY